MLLNIDLLYLCCDVNGPMFTCLNLQLKKGKISAHTLPILNVWLDLGLDLRLWLGLG